MADPQEGGLVTFDPTLDRSGLPPEAGGQPTRTPLQGLTNSLGLQQEFRQAGAAREAGALASAERKRGDLGELRTLTTAQDVERRAAKPATPDLPVAPDLAARPFLAPPKGILDQLQAAMVGATQMVLGAGGLRGNGHAIAAVAGLKGALEGWAAGDNERAKAALTEWHANSEKLQTDYLNRLASYRDILTDQKRSFAERLAEINIRASIDHDTDLALAAKEGNIGHILTIESTREEDARKFAIQIATLQESTAKHHSDADRAERVHRDLQAQRAQVNERAAAAARRSQERLELSKDTSATVMKLQAADTSLTSQLSNAELVADAVAALDAKGLIPKGATTWDKTKAKAMLQTYPGDQEVAKNIDIVSRLGIPLLLKTEMSLGMQASQLRVKSMIEAEAANPTGIPKSFWDIFIPMAKKRWESERNTAREHLRRLDRLPQANTEEGYTVEKVDE